MLQRSVVLALAFIAGTSVAAAQARPQRTRGLEDIGIRALVTTAGGEPANDMMGQGVFARYRLGPEWLVGFAVDAWSFDFERPAAVLGLEQSSAVEVIDSKATRTALSLWAEWEWGGGDRRLQPFLFAGAGVGLTDVDDVSGPLEDGGTFSITTDPGTEFIVTAGTGVRAHLARHLTLEIGARLDYHVASWDVRDTLSDRRGSIGSYQAIGGHVGLSWRF